MKDSEVARIDRDLREIVRELPGELIGPRKGSPTFGDTLCFTCGRLAVPGDMGEPGCPECARREAEFAEYT